MMFGTDYLTMGSTPVDEPCEQLGPNYDSRKARIECSVFAHQLQRLFPNGTFITKSFDHDFGTYYEVVAIFDTGETYKADPARPAEANETARTIAAFHADANTPSNWDAEAKQGLADRLQRLSDNDKTLNDELRL